MSFDSKTFRQRILKHCLWLANSDQDYAKWAAKRYEQDSDGVLEGLHARVVQTITNHLNQPQPEKPSDLSN